MAPYDSADYLKTEADIKNYLEAVFEEPMDRQMLIHTLGVVARARGMMKLSKETGITRAGLARQSYKPDYSVEVYYAYRREFSDFVGVQFKVGLPYFTKNRQDRGLAAALEQSHASEDRKRDLLRELHAAVNQDYVDRRHYAERVADFDASIIPDAERRVETARSAGSARLLERSTNSHRGSAINRRPQIAGRLGLLG